MAENGIELARAIKALRTELTEAIASGEGEELRFALGTIELELQVALEEVTKGDVGIKFWLASAGASRSSGGERTHSIKLSLTAMRDTPQGPQSPVIVGRPQSARPPE